MITATLINYFFHCKTQCWLYWRRIGFVNEKIDKGKTIHKISPAIKEEFFEDFSVDFIDDEYVIEVKKSKSDLEAGKWQLIFYLWKLKQKGIIRKGKLKVFDDEYCEIIELNKNNEEKLMEIISQIDLLLSSPMPEPEYTQKCEGCSYYEYCFI
jgi:CRISPR-associated exonuclease Cas4